MASQGGDTTTAATTTATTTTTTTITVPYDNPSTTANSATTTTVVIVQPPTIPVVVGGQSDDARKKMKAESNNECLILYRQYPVKRHKPRTHNRDRSKSRSRSRSRNSRSRSRERGGDGDGSRGRSKERKSENVPVVVEGEKGKLNVPSNRGRSVSRERNGGGDDDGGRGRSRDRRSGSREREEKKKKSRGRSVSRERHETPEQKLRREQRQKRAGTPPTETWRHTIYVPDNWNEMTAKQKREWFIEQAGGIFTSEHDFKSIRTHERFWNFYSEYGLEDRVLDIYASDEQDGATVGELLDKRKISIEHIVPKVVLKELLLKEGASKETVKGARVNPFNFAPAHNGVNTLRGNYKFDIDGDQILKRGSFGEYLYDFVGFDYQHEWIIPLRSRGDVSRAMLYMVLLYGIKYLTKREIDTLIKWSTDDPIEDSELLYDEWIHSHPSYHHITNPLITHPGMVSLAGLFESVYRQGPDNHAEPVPKEMINQLDRTCKIGGEYSTVKIIELLSCPRENGTKRKEYIVLYNYGTCPVNITDHWQARVIASNSNGADAKVYSLAAKEILPGYKRKIYFVTNDQEVLPQKGAKVVLQLNGKNITSVKYHRLDGLPKQSLD